MSDIYITSDTHFNHRNILMLQGRPFDDVDEMNQSMIENWNRTIGKKDEVWFLGDFGMDNKSCTWRLAEIIEMLNGEINLVIGNHDEHYKDLLRWHKWKSIQHYKKISLNKKSYILSHYPFASWNGQNKQRMHFHGHCHGTLSTKLPYRYDVGVDCHNYTPLHLETFSQEMESWETI